MSGSLLNPVYWRYRYHKQDLLRADYGVRRRKREEKKLAKEAPMFADQPDLFLKPADEYQRIVEESNRITGERWRKGRAESWRRVRAWLRTATEEDRAFFLAYWHKHWSPPHDPCCALDGITHIERMRGRLPGESMFKLQEREEKDVNKTAHAGPARRTDQVVP